MNIIVQVLVGLIAIFGALFFLDTGIAMIRAKDAVTRANMNSPATMWVSRWWRLHCSLEIRP